DGIRDFHVTGVQTCALPIYPLLRGEDRLDGLHANTQIPKVIGFARIGELDDEPAWIDAARFFWETVSQRRSIAFGGNSAREHFRLEERRVGKECRTSGWRSH